MDLLDSSKKRPESARMHLRGQASGFRTRWFRHQSGEWQAFGNCRCNSAHGTGYGAGLGDQEGIGLQD